MTNIASIAEFAQTVSFREAVKPEEGGTIGVVQARDIGYDGTLDVLTVSHVRELPIKGEAPLLQPGEVLLQSRGLAYRAAIVPASLPPMVASGGLYVLRPNRDLVDPRYLVLYLNLPVTQTALRKIATGSHILNIRRDALAEFEVALPPLPDQRAFAELSDLIRRSYEIQQHLHQLRLQELHALAIGRTKKAGGAGALPASTKRSDRRLERRQAKS